MTPEIFEEYRPYNDHEVPAAIHRIAQDLLFPSIVQFVFPGKNWKGFLDDFKQIQTVKEFQQKIMYSAIMHVVELTINTLSYAGVDRLEKEKNYTFISNHRDIVLDSAILDVIFSSQGLDTMEITFGSNLMRSQLVIDIGKINKMFKIIRGGSKREVLLNARHVSEYMRYALTEKRQSTWIAQRNGRTKDGFDQTDTSVLKMLTLGSKKPWLENLEELHITPIAVSYEYEPCDFLKTRELYISRRQPYRKEESEDLNSIKQGIVQPKGNCHYTVCDTLTWEELRSCAESSEKERFKALAALIDQKIYAGYQLWKTHYMSHDLARGESRFSSHYTPDELAQFQEYMDAGLALIDGDYDELRDLFLHIYANPVDNCLPESSLCGDHVRGARRDPWRRDEINRNPS